MNSTLADVNQIFNVKAFATAGLTAEQIPANTLGIIDSSTGLTVVPANYAALPDLFSIVGKLNGKTYYSFDEIQKSHIRNRNKKDYVAPQANVWYATPQNCGCNGCIKGLTFTTWINDMALIQRDGLNGAHRDILVEVTPEEIRCKCDCSTSQPVYENHIMVQLLVEKINAVNSPYYTASVAMNVEGLTSGDTASTPATPALGDVYVDTEANTIAVFDGTDWVVIGVGSTGEITDMDSYITITQPLNTDDDTANDTPMLTLVVTSTVNTTPIYHDLEVNYVYPRGTGLTPSLMIDGRCAVPFTEGNELGYEIGAGYDMRHLEFTIMNYYTNLNYAPQLSDGIQHPNLIYQFENNTNYNTVNFEFFAEKQDQNTGEHRLHGVTFGVKTSLTSVYTALKNAFGV